MHILNIICFFSILFVNCLALKVYKSTAKLKEHNVVSGLHYKNILDQKSNKGRVPGAKTLAQTILFSICSNFCQKKEKSWEGSHFSKSKQTLNVSFLSLMLEEIFWRIFLTNNFDKFFWRIFLTNSLDESFLQIFLTNCLTFHALQAFSDLVFDKNGTKVPIL